MRRLAQSLVSLSLLVPSAAFPLGLGDIHLHSALGQPLRADIDLLSVKPSELPGLSASLASYNTFQRAGVDRPADLMYLNFAVARRRSGGYEIKVTSNRPINEPFLDFLVNVSWNSGRLVREYTLLLDPPDMAKKEAPPAVTAATTPVQSMPAVAPVAPPQTAPRAAPTAAAAGGSGTGVLKYGPVKSDDTLWSIAWRLRPNPSVSVQQVMMALFKANPDAFIHNNVNGIKTGYVLRLNDPAQISAMSKAQALQAVREQARQWQDYKGQAAAKAKTRRQQPGGGAPAVSTAVAAPQSQLKLLAPDQQKAKGGSGNAAAPGEKGKKGLAPLRHDVALALETAEAQRRANDALRKRLNNLEGQMATMQRLLTLKTNQLAALQGGVQSQQGTPAASNVAPAVAAKKPAPAPAAKKPASSVKPKVAPAPVMRHAPKPTPKPVRQAPSIWEGLLDSPVVLGGLAIVALGLLALIWLAMRRRRGGEPFQESILTGGSDSLLKPRGGAGPASEESSLFSDLNVSGMQDVHADDGEVDPLTEAKVYMAYGRYQQAEELLKGVLATSPKQPEVLVKLLELYRDTNNQEAFEKLASEAFALFDGSGPLWDKVAAMGRGLAPENPLFSTAEAVEAPPSEPPSDVFTDSEVLDIGLDLDALAEDMESSAEDGLTGGGSDFDPMLDLSGLDDLDELAEHSAADASAGADKGDGETAPEAVIFDGGEEAGAAAQDEITAEAPADEFPVEAEEEPVAAAEGMEFDLGDFRIDEEAGEETGDAYHDGEHLLDFGAAPGASTDEGGGSETASDEQGEEPAAAEADAIATPEATDAAARNDSMSPVDEAAADDLEQAWSSLSEGGSADDGQSASAAEGDESIPESHSADAAGEEESAAVAGGMEFDLGEFRIDEEDDQGGSDDYHDGEHTLDFGASSEAPVPAPESDEAVAGGDVEAAADEGVATVDTVSGAETAAIDDVDLESELEPFKVETPTADVETPLDDESLEMDLAEQSEPSAGEDVAADADVAASSPEPAGAEAEFNLENMFDELESAAADSGDVDSLDIDDSDLFGEVDETGTKLDLARAYIDMGDTEGAQVLLDEVMKEGSEEQRQQAEVLRKQVP